MKTAMLVLLAAAAAAAAKSDSLPPPGSYGFNWLDPDSPCVRLEAKDIARFRECSASDNAFGLDLPSRACRVDEKVEFIVYATSAQCQEAWETMRANGD